MLPPKPPARKFIPISQITRDPLTQMREEPPTDDYVDRLRAYIRSNGKLEACEVVSDGRHNWLTDGWVRIGILETIDDVGGVECDVYPGTLLDARLKAIGANANHGRNRTPGDIRKAVFALIDSPELLEKVGRKFSGVGGLHGGIAATCSISTRTVDRILEERGLHVHMGKLAARPAPIRSNFGTNNKTCPVTQDAARTTYPQFDSDAEADQFGAFVLGKLAREADARGDHAHADELRKGLAAAEKELRDYPPVRESVPKAPPPPPPTPDEEADRQIWQVEEFVILTQEVLSLLLAGPRADRLKRVAAKKGIPFPKGDVGAWKPLAQIRDTIAGAKR